MRAHEPAAATRKQPPSRPETDIPQAPGAQAPGGPLSAELVAVQRAVGNRAFTTLLGRQRRGPVHDTLAAPGAPLPVGIRAEMEARLGQDFSDVRVHTDPGADASARAVNAYAYTSGCHIVFRRGEFDTGSQRGKALLAHELTHVVQQRAGAVAATPVAGGIALSRPTDRDERAADAVARTVLAGRPGQVTAGPSAAGHAGRGAAPNPAAPGAVPVVPVVQSKLAGTRAAVVDWAGKPSRRGLRSRDTYAKILAALTRYEKLEAAVLRRGQLTMKTQARMLALLDLLERLVDGWLADHGPISAEEARKRAMAADPDDPSLVLDRTADEQRSHALIMLKPRLVNEKRELQRPDYLSIRAWTDQTLTGGKDDAFGGGLNRLDYVEHGAEKGVFIQDRAWDLAGTAGKDLGIPDADANAGARSVAMSKLAELFDTDVIARTEFAVHTSATDRKGRQLPRARTKLGVRQVLAPGKEAAETLAVITPAERTKAKQITLADPTLQRALNILQIIDAIAGQLDRHWHNYYIDTDDNGKVTGVVGIDLDMAFAAHHTTVDPTPVDVHGLPVTKSNFVGMPALVDKAFAAKIRTVTPAQVRTALEGLITDEELDATLRRYRLVRDAVRNIDRKNLIRDWNEQTARRQEDEKTSYLGRMRAGLIKDQFEAPAAAEVRSVCAELGLDDVQALEKLIITDSLLPRVAQGVLTPAEALTIVQDTVTDLRTNRNWRVLLGEFQTRKGVQAAKVAKIRKQLAPLLDEYNSLTTKIITLELRAKKGADNAKRQQEQRLQELRDRKAKLEKQKLAANLRINELNAPDWDRVYRKKRNDWITGLIDYYVQKLQRSRAAQARTSPAKRRTTKRTSGTPARKVVA